MGKRINKAANLTAELPGLPNFIRVGDSAHPLVLPVEQFEESFLRKMGKAWTEALIEHARKRRKQSRRSP